MWRPYDWTDGNHLVAFLRLARAGFVHLHFLQPAPQRVRKSQKLVEMSDSGFKIEIKDEGAVSIENRLHSTVKQSGT